MRQARTSFHALAGAVVLLGLVVAGCVGGSTSVAPPLGGNAAPTPSPSPSAAPSPSSAPSGSPAASAQHLYLVHATGGTSGIAEYALPLTPASTPVLTVPAPLMGTDGIIGPSLAVNAAHVIYTDLVHDAFFVLNQPISASSAPSASFCFAACGDHHNSPSIMTAALSPFDFLAGTDSGNPVASPIVRFYTSPFSNQTVSTSSQQFPGPAAGLAYDAAGNLYAGGSALPPNGDVEKYAGNVMLAHVTAPIFITSVAVNASVLAVAGSTGSPCAGAVLIYTLPFTSTSTPSATITSGLGGNCRYDVALDAAGNLYVNGTTAGISVYAPPLSNASSPSSSLDTGPTNQIVIGP